MRTEQLRRMRILLTALVVLAELLHLAWEYTHGGVISHHFLARPDMPAISNWWGVLLLPALAWFLLGPILRRAQAEGMGKAFPIPRGIVASFVGSFFYALLLAVAFTLGYEEITGYLFLGIFLLALLLPIYRPEFVLGFIFGMTFTFGAVLPTIVSSVVAALSAALHFLVRRVIRRRRRPESTPQKA
ncbi:MAG: hypothetical protein DYG89_19365 [Caldilinea sp. CFX5]|nr:hypothetical protein [Caldilinea sp. CFX5]